MTKIDTTSTTHSKLSEAVSSTNLSRSNPAHANPRRAFRRHAARTAVALATGATPLLCRAEAGELGGVGMVAIVALAAGWVLLTLFLFTMLRRVRPRTRYLASGLFLAAPFLWLAVTFGWFMMTEPRGLTPQGSATTRTAEAPVLMGGATFPAGSHVQYAPVDDHGEASQPSAISSDQPVALGTLSIRGIEHRDSDDDSTFDVALAYEQSIDGWPCAAVTDIGTRIDIGDAHAPTPHLIQCRLAKTVTIGDIAWPPATVVTRAADSRGWSLALVSRHVLAGRARQGLLLRRRFDVGRLRPGPRAAVMAGHAGGGRRCRRGQRHLRRRSEAGAALEPPGRHRAGDGPSRRPRLGRHGLRGGGQHQAALSALRGAGQTGHAPGIELRLAAPSRHRSQPK